MRLLILLSLVTLVCTPVASFDTLEQARAIAKGNGEFNAQEFQAANREYASFSIIAAVDSTQTNTCLSGDGWASLELRGPAGETVLLKCSTVSNAVGCMLDSEFKTKSFSNQDGRCDPSIPALAKIAK